MGKTKPTKHRQVAKKRSDSGAAASVNGKRSQTKLSAKSRHLIKTLQSWLEDESGYDEQTWPWLKKALEEDRMSARGLFRD